MIKHTPGPWRAGCIDGSGLSSIYSKKGERIGETNPGCSCCASSDVNDEQKANATLMAAAPDILKALKGFFKMFNFDQNNFQDAPYKKEWEAAKKAITKAEGRS